MWFKTINGMDNHSSKTVLYADVTTHEINWKNIITYTVTLIDAILEEKLISLIYFLSNRYPEYKLFIDWVELNKDNIYLALWKTDFFMDKETFAHFLKFIRNNISNKNSRFKKEIEEINWYSVWHWVLTIE